MTKQSTTGMMAIGVAGFLGILALTALVALIVAGSFGTSL